MRILLFTLTLSVAVNTLDATAAKNLVIDGVTYREYGHEQSADSSLGRLLRSGNGAQETAVIALDTPFSDQSILPFTRLNPDDAPGRLKLVATPGEYEPASFVIRSGGQALKSVRVSVSDLTSAAGDGDIPASAIDVRLVETWFQSDTVMRRSDRSRPKKLVSELLVHDDNLVSIDPVRQLNRIRLDPHIEDAESILPFDIEPHTNRQLWLTVQIPKKLQPGTYSGRISIDFMQAGEESANLLPLDIEVLPFRLADTSMMHGKFYLARLDRSNKIRFIARGKNPQQMLAELIDMLEHGTDTVAVDHDAEKDRIVGGVYTRLLEQLELVRRAGFGDRPLIYVDWRVRGHKDSGAYSDKLEAVQRTFQRAGLGDFIVYNQDEKDLDTLKRSLHTFDAAHALGRDNIVAVTRPDIALQLHEQLDFALVQHRTTEETIDRMMRLNISPIAYGLPHAGEERPATTRRTYGVDLAMKGFAGTLSYAYQSGDCWDDWMNWDRSNYRPNVLAYPTASVPVPTMQWEAWREAHDDLRYLSTLAGMTGSTHKEVLLDAPAGVRNEPDLLRSHIISRIKLILDMRNGVGTP